MSTLPTYTATIYIAADEAQARAVLRRECYERGLCVTVTPTTFVYTGGEERGVAIGLVNYPRFPSSPGDLFRRAVEVARRLLGECCQRSALVVAPDITEWICVEPPGSAKPENAR